MTPFTTLFTELVRTEIELWNDLDAHLLAAVGISLPQFQALAAIAAQSDNARVQNISAQMSITIGATSKLVDRLERDNLAERSAHPTDRRSSVVSLTVSGAEALAAAEEAAEAHLARVIGDSVSLEGADRLTNELASLRASVRIGAQR